MMPQSSIVICETENGQTHIEVMFEQDTLWLSLLQIAELFERDKSVISRHLKNIFNAGELVKNSVVAKNATTVTDGKSIRSSILISTRSFPLVIASIPEKAFSFVSGPVTCSNNTWFKAMHSW